MIQRDIAKNVDGQLGASIRDAEHQQANPDQAIQVASLFGWAGNIFSKMNPKIRTGKVVDNFNTNKGNVRSPSKDDIDAMLGDIEAEQGHTMAGTEDELAPIGPTPPEIPETGLHVEPDGPAKLFDEAMKTEVPTEKIT
ncbi:MAG: hypothetical protein GY734_06960, partial [Herbaspirillum sp.]|nr:hypothetical protein [Herbaspirillum sp.]